MSRVLVALFACVLIAGLSDLAQAEFYPTRPVYDYNKYDPNRRDCADPTNLSADHGRCGPSDGPVFDSFINTPSYGDERAFFDGQTPRSTADPVNVSRVREALLRIYVNNDANEQAGYRTTATGTLVRVLLPTAGSTVLRARAYISAQNALPETVEDTVDLVSTGKFRVEYVPGSARLLRGTAGRPTSYGLLDSIVSSGAPIGDKAMDGVYPAGFNKAALVELRVKVVPVGNGGAGVSAWIIGMVVALGVLVLLLSSRIRAAIVRAAKTLWKAIRPGELWQKVLASVIAGVILIGIGALIKVLIS